MFAEKNKSERINEVGFANHIYEFLRFYEKHKGFCDEISGVKERILIEDGKEKVFFIGVENFGFGIKRLNSFVIDNLHYIKDMEDVRRLEKLISTLDDDYNSDLEYQRLSNLEVRSSEQEVKLLEWYLQYLFRCYDIANYMFNLLQSSLMIGTKDIKKAVSYFNDTPFFEKLSLYRDEVSDDLANFKLRNIFHHIKRISGYYYTYRLFMNPKDSARVDRIIQLVLSYCFSRDVNRLIIQIREQRNLNSEDLRIAMEITSKIRYILSKIYYMTNKGLSDKNILPKIQKRVHIDMTLI